MPKKYPPLLIFLILILAGCSSSTTPNISSMGGIWATNISTSIGSKNNDVSQQVITYQITLQNREPMAVTVHSVMLLFPKELDLRIKSDRNVTLENTIASKGTIHINGQVEFDATGVTKEQISGWGPPIKGIFATTEQPIIIQTQETLP
jgi:hypothetical protein